MKDTPQNNIHSIFNSNEESKQIYKYGFGSKIVDGFKGLFNRNTPDDDDFRNSFYGYRYDRSASSKKEANDYGRSWVSNGLKSRWKKLEDNARTIGKQYPETEALMQNYNMYKTELDDNEPGNEYLGGTYFKASVRPNSGLDFNKPHIQYATYYHDGQPYYSVTNAVHENAHAASGAFSKPQDILIDKGMKEHNYTDDYWDKGTEVYSRLMQLREHFNLNPNHTFDTSDLERMRGMAGSKGFNVLDRYDDDTLLYLLNDVAYDSSNTNNSENNLNDSHLNNTTYARNGGVLKAQPGVVLKSIGKAVSNATKTNKAITVAERLGIPKGLRSDPRALEDPYYWGYKQWNQRYNSALNKGDYPEVQRIRDLHFKVKAPNTKVVDENGMPLHVYHGQSSGKHFNQFMFGGNEEPTIINPVEHEVRGRNIISRSYADGTVQTGKRGEPEPPELRNAHIVRKRQFIPSDDSAPPAYHTSIKDHALSSYTNEDKVVFDDYLNIENPFSYAPETLFQGMSPKYDGVKKSPPSGMRQHGYRDTNGNLVIERVPNTKPTYEGIADGAFFGGKTRKTAMEHGHDGLFIPQYYNSYLPLNSASQIKSARSVTYDDIGNIIPIVKRDNFHNLDIRYKQGGKIKSIF